jgi:molybdate transport system substrate-binding protein
MKLPPRTPRRTVGLLLSSLLLCAGNSPGAEIKVMTSGAFTAAYLELKPQFERATQNKLITLATTMGTGPDYIPTRLQRGEGVDVVVVDDAALDELIKDGKILANSKTRLARSIIGAAVRSGTPKPDISSVDALRRTLLQAKSIAYSASVSGVYVSTELFQRLGIPDQVAVKSYRIDRERVGTVVARGEAEIGFQQVSELLPIQGIDYIGPLPPEVQRPTVFSTGVTAGAKEPEAARALIKFLASPAAIPAITKSGMEPVARP